MRQQTWVLVADGSHARLFRIGERREDWILLSEFDHPPSREANQELAANRPDQIQHQFEKTARGNNQDSYRVIEFHHFARQLADHLHHQASINAFDQLVLAAGPKFLGALRTHLTDPVRARVVTEVPKDYTQVREDQLAELIQLP